MEHFEESFWKVVYLYMRKALLGQASVVPWMPRHIEALFTAASVLIHLEYNDLQWQSVYEVQQVIAQVNSRVLTYALLYFCLYGERDEHLKVFPSEAASIALAKKFLSIPHVEDLKQLLDGDPRDVLRKIIKFIMDSNEFDLSDNDLTEEE